MRKHPFWYLVIAVGILVIPTTIYLCFLVPQLSERYNILMSSAGIIGGSGFYGASKIPDSWKYSSIFKTSANAFTVLIVSTLVNEFAMKLIILVALFIICFVVYKIFVEVYKGAKRKLENQQLASEVARSIDKTIK